MGLWAPPGRCQAILGGIMNKTPAPPWHKYGRHWRLALAAAAVALAVLLVIVAFLARSSSVRNASQPYKVSSNGRYLTDRAGQPFFMQADTAWNLFTRLTNDEVTQYPVSYTHLRAHET